MVDPVTRPPFNRAKAEQEISWLGARLREPSTYAGLGILLTALHVASAGSWASALTSIGMGVGGAIAIVMGEKK